MVITGFFCAVQDVRLISIHQDLIYSIDDFKIPIHNIPKCKIANIV